MFFAKPFERTQAQETNYSETIPQRIGTRSGVAIAQSSEGLFSTASSGVIRKVLMPNGLYKDVLVMRTVE